MYVVITTENFNGHDSRTCDLLETRGEALEFAGSQKRGLQASRRAGIIEVHEVSEYTLAASAIRVNVQAPSPARKRGCSR